MAWSAGLLANIRVPWLCLGILLAMLAGPGLAAEPACFCLAHPTGGIVRSGCRELPAPPTRFAPIVECQTADRHGSEPIEPPIRDFARVPGGQASCNPCFRLPDGDLIERIRQPDGSVTPEQSDGAE